MHSFKQSLKSNTDLTILWHITSGMLRTQNEMLLMSQKLHIYKNAY